MKFLIISIFFSFVLAEPPYPSRGYRPTGPAFQLPNRINTQFWQAENQYASPRNVYGAPNNAYDAHTAPGFQKPYSTINLPPNQYGIPSESTNSLQNQYGAPLNIKPNQNNQYQAPSSLTNSNRNQFNLMQQQLPGTNGARFYTRTNQNQYSKAIRNSPQAEVIRSIDISPQISLETQNQYQAQTNTNNQAANQFPPQSNAGYPQQPQLNYGSPDNIGNTQGGSNDIDVRAGDNEQTDNNVNLSFDANDQDNQGRDGDNDFGSGFGSTNQDGFYIPPKPTIRPAREPSEPIEPEVTTTPESTDYEDNETDDNNNGPNVAISTAVANGQYYLLQPDGRLQRVTYKTTPNANDKGTGFTANLVYENVEPIRDPIYTYNENLPLVRINK